MKKTTFVQVLECGPEGKRPMHRLPLGTFIHHAIGRLPPGEIMRLRTDLSAHGRARMDGRLGRWHEYEIVSDQGG